MKIYGYYDIKKKEGVIINIPHNSNLKIQKFIDNFIKSFNNTCFSKLNLPNYIIIRNKHMFEIIKENRIFKINNDFKYKELFPRIYSVYNMINWQFDEEKKNGNKYFNAI